jgi:hypothetical protein
MRVRRGRPRLLDRHRVAARPAATATAATRARTAAVGGRTAAARTLRRRVPQHFVSLHDLGDLAVPVSTECDGKQLLHRGALRRRQSAHAQALPLKHG